MPTHSPRYKYDCSRCKFNWCCGYTCRCVLREKPTPPINIRRKVNEALVKEGYQPEFKSETSRTLVL